MYKIIFAKSNENGGTQLYEHSIATMNVTKKLCQDAEIDEKYASICLISSLFHDIGKVHHLFQEKLSQKETDGKGYSHNILSAKIFTERVNVEGIPVNNVKELISKVILYHHPVNNNFDERTYSFFGCKDERLKYVDEDDISAADKFVDVFVNEYNKLAESLGYTSRIHKINSDNETLTDFSYFKDNPSRMSNNHILNYASGVLRFADIISSSDGDIEKHTKLSTCFNFGSFVCPEKYDKDRFLMQTFTADEMSKKTVSVLAATTSFGKTMTGLIWGLINGRKLIWVCPTNAIASSIYRSVKNELTELGISNSISVGLLLTNKWVHGEEQGTLNDIIVTNFDNYARPMFKSDSKKHLSYNINHSNVIFDEFHLYATEDAILSDFITSLRARTISENNRTLLMSATPNPKLYDFLDKENNHVYINNITNNDINGRKFKVMYNKQHKDGNTLIVRNSVSASQASYSLIPTENKMLFHAQFIDEHLERNISQILSSHGKNGNNKELTVSATNMATTALDISFSRLECSVMPIHELIQAVGRINRHSFNDEIGEIVIDESSLTDKREICSVKNKYDVGLMKTEFALFKDRFKDGQIIKLSELYELYGDIQNSPEYRAKYDDYFKKVKKKSFINLSKIPYLYGQETSGDNKPRISKTPSLRGDETVCNVFIRCEDGMENGQFMQIGTIPEEKFSEYSLNMYDYINKNNLEGIYYSNREEHIFKRMYKNGDKEKMARMYIMKAKQCDTPFILPSDKYTYDDEYGLRKC